MINKSKNQYFIILTFSILFLFINQVIAISSGANEPIADNELGLTAKDCALQYCTIKDGMSLWLTMVNECVSNPNPYFASIDSKNFEKETYYGDEEVNNLIYTHKIVGSSVIAFCSFVGLILGYIIGRKKALNQKYTNLSIK